MGGVRCPKCGNGAVNVKPRARHYLVECPRCGAASKHRYPRPSKK